MPAQIETLPAIARTQPRPGYRNALRGLLGIDDQYRQMQALSQLDDDRLTDIGLTRTAVEAELLRCGFRR